MLFNKKRSFKRKQYKKRNPLKGWFHKSFNPYITLSVQNNIPEKFTEYIIDESEFEYLDK